MPANLTTPAERSEPPINAERAPVEAGSANATWGWLLLILGAFVWHLKEEWTLNPQYFYGWGVPILGMLIFRQRWRERPAVAPAEKARCLLAALITGLALWLPLRVVREANMDWRLAQWAIGLGAIALLLGAFYWMGGRSWARHFAFPTLFLLIAIPWPTRLEHLVIQSSTEAVVRGAVEALRWMGIAAWSAGSVIQLPGTAVGVDEACSGLRSFQGALMCALFLGETLRLTLARRVGLLLLGAVFALSLNLLRTIFLTLVAARRGATEVTAWHDGTGLATLAVAFVLLWMTARFLRTDRPAVPAESSAFRRIGLPATIGLAAWLVAVECASGLWFRAHEREPARAAWNFDRTAMADLRPESIPQRTQAILRYNRGEAFRRGPDDGTQWWIYALTWDRDGGGSPLARFHSPEVCLPAAGFKLAGQGRTVTVAEGLPFRSYEFEWLGKPVFLFSSFLASSGAAAVSSMDQFDLTWRKRLNLALAGQRPAEQRVFQVVIAGVASRAAAEESFRIFAEKTLKSGK